MSYCLCCNSELLRHVRYGGKVYLYCLRCRQEMPESTNCRVSRAYSALSKGLLTPLTALKTNAALENS